MSLKIFVLRRAANRLTDQASFQSVIWYGPAKPNTESFDRVMNTGAFLIPRAVLVLGGLLFCAAARGDNIVGTVTSVAGVPVPGPTRGAGLGEGGEVAVDRVVVGDRRVEGVVGGAVTGQGQWADARHGPAGEGRQTEIGEAEVSRTGRVDRGALSADGEEAVSLANSLHPDLVLCLHFNA